MIDSANTVTYKPATASIIFDHPLNPIVPQNRRYLWPRPANGWALSETHPNRMRREHPDWRDWRRCRTRTPAGGTRCKPSGQPCGPRGHGRFDGTSRSYEPVIQRHVERVQFIASAELAEACQLRWRSVGEQALLEQETGKCACAVDAVPRPIGNQL